MASPDLSVSTSPTSVSLASQGEEQSPTITYTNVKELHKVIRQVPGDFLIVQNVSPADFEQISRPERRGFRVRRYHADRRLLIITIPTALHEALHINLYVAFLFKIGPIAQDIWKSIMSTTLRPQGHPGGDGGEGDSSGGPMSVRHDKYAWPTLVIEAGDSESLHALRDDMRWWFSASDHQVKIVLLAKFDHRLQQILIERWEEEAATRPGATTTRRAATFGASQPVLQQSITITRDPATGSYQVARSDLVLSFRLLFLRDPGPQEGDVIIPTEDLQHSPEIDLQVNSKASQSTAAPGRLVSTEFFMGDHLTYDIPRGPFRSSYDWLNAILTIIIRNQTLVLEKSEDEDDIEDAEDILPVAQTLLTLLPKVFPPELTTSESSALQHHDLNLNNILVNEQGEVTAVLDWECVSALPLWMLTQMPKFLEGEPREDEPQRDIYADETPEEAAAEADKRNDPDYLDNEGKNELYWIHKMEYEQTQLRRVYKARIKELCPEWAEESPLENDFYEAVSQCDGIWKKKARRWAERVEKGEAVRFKDV